MSERVAAAATGCRSISNSRRRLTGAECPSAVRAVVRPAAGRANAVPVLEAAAVIGRQMDRGLLCAVVDLSDDEVDGVIDELEDALVFEPWGTDGWRFATSCCARSPPSCAASVRGLHAKVADAMVGAGGERTGGWSPPTKTRPSGSTRRLAYQASAAAGRRGALGQARTHLSHRKRYSIGHWRPLTFTARLLWGDTVRANNVNHATHGTVCGSARPASGRSNRSEPMAGIEPAYSAWEADVLPLNYIGLGDHEG